MYTCKLPGWRSEQHVGNSLKTRAIFKNRTRPEHLCIVSTLVAVNSSSEMTLWSPCKSRPPIQHFVSNLERSSRKSSLWLSRVLPWTGVWGEFFWKGERLSTLNFFEDATEVKRLLNFDRRLSIYLISMELFVRFSCGTGWTIIAEYLAIREVCANFVTINCFRPEKARKAVPYYYVMPLQCCSTFPTAQKWLQHNSFLSSLVGVMKGYRFRSNNQHSTKWVTKGVW